MKILKKNGFTETQIDDLVDIVIRNTDYHNAFSNREHNFKVSPLFVNRSKYPLKQIENLTRINIHNIVMLNIVTNEVNFKVVSCDGLCYDFALPREPNRKSLIIKAIEQSIEYFLNLSNT